MLHTRKTPASCSRRDFVGRHHPDTAQSRPMDLSVLEGDSLPGNAVQRCPMLPGPQAQSASSVSLRPVADCNPRGVVTNSRSGTTCSYNPLVTYRFLAAAIQGASTRTPPRVLTRIATHTGFPIRLCTLACEQPSCGQDSFVPLGNQIKPPMMPTANMQPPNRIDSARASVLVVPRTVRAAIIEPSRTPQPAMVIGSIDSR